MNKQESLKIESQKGCFRNNFIKKIKLVIFVYI